MTTRRIGIQDLDDSGMDGRSVLALDLSDETDERVRHRRLFSRILACANIVANVGRCGPANVVEMSSGDLIGTNEDSIAGLKIVKNQAANEDIQKIIVRRETEEENIEVHLSLKLN